MLVSAVNAWLPPRVVTVKVESPIVPNSPTVSSSAVAIRIEYIRFRRLATRNSRPTMAIEITNQTLSQTARQNGNPNIEI